MTKQRSLPRGVIAGVAGGLVAAWAMNEFMAGPGQALQQAVSGGGSESQTSSAKPSNAEPQDDATMKTADAIVSIATGGRHLTRAQKEKGGPIVHYAFGAIMGGLYGGLAEYFSGVTSGFGTTFGSALFGGADMLAVPVLNLSGSGETSASSLASPFAAHLVYGVVTESVRRGVRLALSF
ncbi:MAG TPA: hypothetical protein VHX11_06955 [Acidobacteriaceae bacterium]|jgi:hypothetical protein|nr:hypothetical protein [Acidobacteriaceae bacterium]